MSENEATTPHEWVKGGSGLFGACVLVFKTCASCGMTIAVSRDEYDRLPRAAHEHAKALKLRQYRGRWVWITRADGKTTVWLCIGGRKPLAHLPVWRRRLLHLPAIRLRLV